MFSDRFTRQEAVISVAAAGNKGTSILMATVMAVYIGRVGTPLAVSLVLAVFFLGRMVFAPLWGAVADLTGSHRRVLLASSGLAALTIPPLAVVDGIRGPLALRTLFAVFVAGFLPVMFTIMNERGGATDRGREVGLFGSAAAAGSMLGRSASGPLVDHFTREFVYVFLAVAGGFVVLTCLFVDDPTPESSTGGAGIETWAAFVSTLRGRFLPTSGDGTAHLRTNGLHWLYVASLLRNATVIGMMSLLPVYLVAELDLSPATMGLLLGINPAVQMVGMYSLGRLSDVSGRKRLITGGLVGSGVFALLTPVASLPSSALARTAVAGTGLITLGVAYSGLQTGMVAFIGDVAPAERESELIGLRSTARGFGGVVGPPLLGIGATAVGYEPTFAAASLLAFGGAVLVSYRLTESHGSRGSAPTATAEGK
jgi:MFS family permease